MKVLVIEDKKMHRESAVDTLIGHELTVVDSFDDAMRVMDAVWEKEPLAFEVVLTDMMMPMSKKTLVHEAYKPDEQIPYGFVIALVAAHRGAKFVAMLTDMNHHHGAMSAAIDHLAPSYYEVEKSYDIGPKVFIINNARVVFVHAPFVEDCFPDSDCTCRSGLCSGCYGTLINYNGGDQCWCTRKEWAGKCSYCHGTLKYTKKIKERKDWGRVLIDLMTWEDENV